MGNNKIRRLKANIGTFLTSMLLLVSLSASSKDDAQTSPANAIKTAFLNNFIAFSQWPETVDRNKLKIGVLDNVEIFKQLQILKQGETTKNDYELFQFKSLDKYQDVDVLWVGNIALSQFRNEIESKPVMIIGEGLNCWNQNLHICLIEENDSYRFKIDLYTFQKSNIKISSRVIRLAKEIRNPTN